MDIHPAALIFPEMSAAEFDAFKADIRANGQRETIKTAGGKILDGRHRYRACAELGLTPRFEEAPQGDAVAYVLSLNLQRRHLSEAQRAMVAARILSLGKGGDRTSENFKASIDALKFTQAQAAGLLNVGRASVQRAKAVIDHAIPEVIAAVDAGKMSVFAAAHLAEKSPVEQSEVMEKGPPPTRRGRPLNGQSKKNRPDRRSGTHRTTNDELDKTVNEVNALLSKWEALGGLRKLTTNWEREQRWKLCDKLENLARILRRHATDLRHHVSTPSA